MAKASQFIVQAYQCDKCEFLTASKSSFSKHQKKHKAQEASAAFQAKEQEEYKRKSNELRLKLSNIDDLQQALNEHAKLFNWDVNVEVGPLRFDRSLSASGYRHPLEWTEKDGPRQPGWHGRIKVTGTIRKKSTTGSTFDTWVSDCLKSCKGVHTSLSGSSTEVNGEICMFIADFPKLYEQYKRFEEIDQVREISIAWRKANVESFVSKLITRYRDQDTALCSIKHEMELLEGRLTEQRRILEKRKSEIDKLCGSGIAIQVFRKWPEYMELAKQLGINYPKE